jgi:hypothetical protein
MSDAAITKDAKLTATSDTAGIKVAICNPDWFDRKKSDYVIANSPARYSSLTFTGEDLNFAARVLYAEVSGQGDLPNKTERMKEKEAVLNVMAIRFNRKGYPNNNYVAKSFTEVGKAPSRQFDAAASLTRKFRNSDTGEYQKLKAKECEDLDEAIEAVRNFLNSGPDTKTYQYDNYRTWEKDKPGTRIGNLRFMLTTNGKAMLNKEP